MEVPLIAFIIPVYNTPQGLLEECLESIAKINVEKEIIIVDDGSKAAYTNLDEERYHIVHIEHAGLSVARNFGLHKATADYIQFVDADDRLLPDVYQQIADIVKKEKPNIFCFGLSNSDTLEKHTGIIKHTKYRSGAEYMYRHNLHGSACGYLFRRSILGNLTFTQGILHEDEEFTPLLFLNAINVFCTNRVAYFYRKTEHSITHSTDEPHIRQRLNDFRDIIIRLQSHCTSLHDEKHRRALQRRIAQLSMDYLYNIIRNRQRTELRQRIAEMKQHHLYPLPLRFYTLKYYIFALLTRL